MLFRVGKAFAGLCVIGLALSFVVTITRFNAYLGFLETHLSPDGDISQPLSFFVRLHFALLTMTVLAFVLVMADRFRKRMVADFSAIGRYRSSWCVLVVASIVGQVLFGQTYLFREDGLLETATAVLALAAAGLLLFHAFVTRDRVHRTILFCLAFGFFLFGMEEISWGQRLAGWATPDGWAAVNHQQETNLHNLLNPFFCWLLIGFNLFMAVLLLWAKRSSLLLRSDRIACLLPGATLTHFGYVFLFLAATCGCCGGEATEQVFAVFGASYALSLGKNERTSNAHSRSSSGSLSPGQIANRIASPAAE